MECKDCGNRTSFHIAELSWNRYEFTETGEQIGGGSHILTEYSHTIECAECSSDNIDKGDK
jgi:hypothetical protein